MKNLNMEDDLFKYFMDLTKDNTEKTAVFCQNKLTDTAFILDKLKYFEYINLNNNELNDLKLINNSNIVKLTLSSNPLKEINISDCENLIVLYAKDCINLNKIEINNCPNLTVVYLDFCEKLKYINLNDIPNLKKLSLYQCKNIIELKIPENINIIS